MFWYNRVKSIIEFELKVDLVRANFFYISKPKRTSFTMHKDRKLGSRTYELIRLIDENDLSHVAELTSLDVIAICMHFKMY